MKPRFQEGNFQFCMKFNQILLSGSYKVFVENILRQNFEACCNQTQELAAQIAQGEEPECNDQASQDEQAMDQFTDQYEQQDDIDDGQFGVKPVSFEFSSTNNGTIKGFGDKDQNNQQDHWRYLEEGQQQPCSSHSSEQEDEQTDSNYSFDLRPQPNQDQPINIPGEEPPNYEFASSLDIYYLNNPFQAFYVSQYGQAQGLGQNQIKQIKQTQYTPDQTECSSQKCSICLEDMQIGDQVMILQCKHGYHSSCLRLWLKDKSICPNCRHSLKSTEK